ncbi:MAG TPA: CDP-alcohol phosphatidyltransferase family protein [Chthoniobacterales bacterium]|nr:CDP-alcohol phosphatidyltransferase family protein [Chthoniobacterales bacterium]
MGQYEPTSRRPIADGFRSTARLATALCVRLGVHPDSISYASIVAAAAAAFCFWKSGSSPWLLILAPLLCYLRLWFNMLDGMVALASGQASWRGEILNDLPDRVSDVLIFVGVAHSGWMNPFLGYWAAMFALLTAYVGMFGQAVGVHREFSGVMSKPWRMVTLHLAAWITLVCLWCGSALRLGSLTVLDWASLIVVAGCLQTMFIRLKRIMAALRAKSSAP